MKYAFAAMAFWIFFVTMMMIHHSNQNDAFREICREVGGVPVTTLNEKVCLSINAVVDVEQ